MNLTFYSYWLPAIFTWVGLFTMIYYDGERKVWDRVPNGAAVLWFLAGCIPFANWFIGIASMFSLLGNEQIRSWLVAPVRKVDKSSK
jgi:hypothetical protein